MAYALHDYKCPACGAWRRDVLVSMDIGGRAGAPVCPQGCTTPPRASMADHPATPLIPLRMDWTPTRCRLDAYDVRKFEVVDARGMTQTIETLRDIRRVERESEQHARDGEGSRIVWRTYAQDQSNKDVHTLAKRLDRAMDDQDRPDLTVPGKTLQPSRGPAIRQQHSEQGGSTALPHSPQEW